MSTPKVGALNTITIIQADGEKATIPLDAPPPMQQGELVGYTEQGGRSRFVRAVDVVGWQWDGKTHLPRRGEQ